VQKGTKRTLLPYAPSERAYLRKSTEKVTHDDSNP
jgi:hypothetical protein